MKPTPLPRWVIAPIFAALCVYSPLGWCPPPPGAPLTPDFVTFDFGKVPIGETGSLAVSYLLNPVTAGSGPYVVSNAPYFFYYNQEGAFSVDLSRTTCVPGTTITTTSGCVVTMDFRPTTFGPKFAQYFELNVCLDVVPSCASPSIGSAINFTGFGTPSPAPTLSLSALVLLIVFTLAAGIYALRLRVRAP